MAINGITVYDFSCLTANLDGVFFFSGIQELEMGGEVLKDGEQVYQAGFITPAAFTQPTFDGKAGFSITLLAGAAQQLRSYLRDTKGGSVFRVPTYEPKSILNAIWEREGSTYVITLANVQFIEQSVASVSSPDDRKPTTEKFGMHCTNLAKNGIWIVNEHGAY
jgi:hypothetical protein